MNICMFLCATTDIYVMFCTKFRKRDGFVDNYIHAGIYIFQNNPPPLVAGKNIPWDQFGGKIWQVFMKIVKRKG